MGGRRRAGRTIENGSATKAEPLLEEAVTVDGLFARVNDFALEKRKHTETLNEAQSAINKIYNSFSPAERVRFFSMLYDRFAERYDEHMGVETHHYQAIQRVLGYAAPFLRRPILDITAGTGEPLKYALEIMALGEKMRYFGLPTLVPAQDSELAMANEISPKMLEQAKRKLSSVELISHSAYELPDGCRGKFATVLCSQTFHIISDEDKPRLVRSIKESLVPGGIAVIIEEDPFKISQTPPIEAVSLFLRAIVRPVKARTLIGYFEANDFTKLEERAVAPIDSEHSMRLHLFRKE
jgi:SAM-dependent methyltransferase